MYSEIKKCRISGNDNLISVLSLGDQNLTGIFPKKTNEEITRGPLELVWSPVSQLLQLKHSYELDEMYGEQYGYRSGLNQSMVTHLTNKIHNLEKKVNLSSGDGVIDIGSNDATSLKAYTTPGLKRLGVDPTGNKFRTYYTDGIDLIAEFFPAKNSGIRLATRKLRSSPPSRCFMTWRILSGLQDQSMKTCIKKVSGILNRVICLLCFD